MKTNSLNTNNRHKTQHKMRCNDITRSDDDNKQTNMQVFETVSRRTEGMIRLAVCITLATILQSISWSGLFATCRSCSSLPPTTSTSLGTSSAPPNTWGRSLVGSLAVRTGAGIRRRTFCSHPPASTSQGSRGWGSRRCWLRGRALEGSGTYRRK